MEISVAKFLSLPETETFGIHDKFAYLVKSLDGDSYYLLELLPELGIIDYDLGERIYIDISTDVDYSDVFGWYVEWMGLK